MIKSELTLDQQKAICEDFLHSQFGQFFMERIWWNLSDELTYGTRSDVPFVHCVLNMDIEDSERASLCKVISAELVHYEGQELSEDELGDIFIDVFLCWESNIDDCIDWVFPDDCEVNCTNHVSMSEYAYNYNVNPVDIVIGGNFPDIYA